MRQKYCAQHSPGHSSAWVSIEELLKVRIYHLLAHKPIPDKHCGVNLDPDIRTAPLAVRPVGVAAGTVGLYLFPPEELQLHDLVHSYTLFALHTSAPYVRKHKTYEHANFRSEGTGRGYGNHSFLTSLSELYAAEYK